MFFANNFLFLPPLYQAQFQPLALWKPMLERQVLVQGKMVYSRASSLRRRVTLLPNTISTSQCRQGLWGGGGETEQRDRGVRVEKFSACSAAVYSDMDLETGHARAWCSLSWFYIILVPWLEVSKFPRAGLPEGWGLHHLNLVPRILIQTHCSSTSCILESALTETMSEEWWGGLHLSIFKTLSFSKSLTKFLSICQMGCCLIHEFLNKTKLIFKFSWIFVI